MTAILLVLRGMHTGVICNNYNKTCIYTCVRRCEKRVCRNIKTNMLHSAE